jgi:hypothetical protein
MALNGFPPQTISCLDRIVRKARERLQHLIKTSGDDRARPSRRKSTDPGGLDVW